MRLNLQSARTVFSELGWDLAGRSNREPELPRQVGMREVEKRRPTP